MRRTNQQKGEDGSKRRMSDPHSRMNKITIIGDIMCEPRMLKAARSDGGYDFSGVFSEVKDLFRRSDYVIGNLETPLAGIDAGYTHGLFTFNAPDELADAVRGAGIDLVITANNHCLDRGIDGLTRTMSVLKQKGIPYVGTGMNDREPGGVVCRSVGETKIAVLAYTYGTNYASNRLLLEDKGYPSVNLLRPQQEFYYVSKDQPRVSLPMKVFNRLLRRMKLEHRYAVKRALGMQYNQAHEDNSLNEQTAEPYLKKMAEDIPEFVYEKVRNMQCASINFLKSALA